jgi:hypothetical protein
MSTAPGTIREGSTHQSTTFLYIDCVQIRRPPDLAVKPVNATHGDIVTQMCAECPSIPKLDSHSAKQTLCPLVIEFGRDAQIDRDSSYSCSVELFTQADGCFDGEHGWVRESVECSISYTSRCHCACCHDCCRECSIGSVETLSDLYPESRPVKVGVSADQSRIS